MIANAVVGLVTAAGSSLLGTVNGLWSSAGLGPATAGAQWFLRLDDWLPVSDVALMIGIVSGLAVFMIAFKVAMWIVTLIRG